MQRTKLLNEELAKLQTELSALHDADKRFGKLPPSHGIAPINEAFYGRDAILVKAESLVDKIRKFGETQSHLEFSSSNCPPLKELEKLLGDKFNMDLSIQILGPRPIAAMANAAFGDMYGAFFNLMGSTPNAFTMPVGNRWEFVPLSSVESSDGIKFSRRVSVNVTMTAPLFFSKSTDSKLIMAIMLHEIGHNFFLNTDVRIKRAIIACARVVACIYGMRAIFTQPADIANSANLSPLDADKVDIAAAITNLQKDGLVALSGAEKGLLLGAFRTVMTLVTGGFGFIGEYVSRALMAFWGFVEKVTSRVLPADFRRQVYKKSAQASISLEGLLPAQLYSMIVNYVLMLSSMASGFPLVMAILPLVLVNIVGSFFTDARADEVYADGFATRHGYGPQVAQFAALFSSLGPQGLKTREMSGFIKSIVRIFTLVAHIKDPHPVMVLRAAQASTDLQAEMDAGNIPPALVKTVRMQIDRINKETSKMRSRIKGTVDEETLVFAQRLTDFETGKGTLKDVSDEFGRVLDGKPTKLSESAMLTEGLGSFMKNLATGDVEDEIEELTNEAKDIHTPEQQRYVITKIIRLLERLVILRHSPSKVQSYVHDSISFFQRAIGDKDAGKEMTVRIGENIRVLATLRDKVLSKKWNDDKWNEEVDNLKDKVKTIIDKASSTSADAFE
jgi:hypothetical protein